MPCPLSQAGEVTERSEAGVSTHLCASHHPHPALRADLSREAGEVYIEPRIREMTDICSAQAGGPLESGP
jgi:hypothetical protein